MKVLAPNSRLNNYYLLEAARSVGYESHAVINLSEQKQRDRLREKFSDHFVCAEIPSRFDLDYSEDDYLDFYKFFLEDYVKHNRIDLFAPCSSNDYLISILASINEDLGLPGITRKQAELFTDKEKYCKEFSKVGFKVPQLYEVVDPQGMPEQSEEYQYPVVCKPARGTGGMGLYVANNEYDLFWFFGPNEDDSAFSDVSLFNHNYFFGGLRNYLYKNLRGNYLVQEYVDGPTISVSGIFHKDGVRIDLIYDIESSDLPFRTEIGFSYPSRYDFDHNQIHDMFVQAQKHMAIPNGPFMADFILNHGDLYLVDFSPRCSSSGLEMLYHSTDSHYHGINAFRSILGEPLVDQPEYQATIMQHFMFPKGEVKQIRVPRGEGDIKHVECNLKPGDQIYEMRNDIQMIDRGYAVAVGNSRREAEDYMNSYLPRINYVIE